MSGLGSTKTSDAGILERTITDTEAARKGHALPELEESTLLASLRQGSDEAYEQLVRAHQRWMFALASRLLGSDKDVADVVQETFISAFRSMPMFRGDARLSTWLRKILVNHALMKLRSRRRKPEESLDALLPEFLPDGHQAHPTPTWAELPDTAVFQRETRELVQGCIANLPESYRTVLILRDIEELDTQEVASLLNVTPNSVKIRLHRARQALKTLLDPHFGGAPV